MTFENEIIAQVDFANCPRVSPGSFYLNRNTTSKNHLRHSHHIQPEEELAFIQPWVQ